MNTFPEHSFESLSQRKNKKLSIDIFKSPYDTDEEKEEVQKIEETKEYLDETHNSLFPDGYPFKNKKQENWDEYVNVWFHSPLEIPDLNKVLKIYDYQIKRVYDNRWLFDWTFYYGLYEKKCAPTFDILDSALAEVGYKLYKIV